MKNFSPIKRRMLEMLEKKGFSKNKFYIESGISNGVLDKETGVTEQVIAKFISTFPDINPEWLLTGKGEMLRGNNAIAVAKRTDNPSEGIPLLPISAMAGIFTDGDVQIMDFECERYVIPMFGKYDFLIQVKGSSMYPKYSSGDVVGVKKLNSWSFFQHGKVYVIYTEQGVIVKRIFAGKDDDHVQIFSDNEQKYPAFDLHKKEIKGVGIVVGVIRLE